MFDELNSSKPLVKVRLYDRSSFNDEVSWLLQFTNFRSYRRYGGKRPKQTLRTKGRRAKLCVYRWDIVGVKVVSAVYHTTLRKELRNERFLSLCRTEKKILQSAIYCF